MNAARLVSLFVLLGVSGVALAEGPVDYPQDLGFVSSKSRAEVKADVLEARRLGLLSVADVEIVIAHEAPVSGKSRAQVAAEYQEAHRLGLVLRAGEADMPMGSADEERQIAEAGERALERQSLAQK